MRITEYRRKVNTLKAECGLLERQLKGEQERLSGLKQDRGDLDKARVLIQEAAIQTQETLRIRLTAIATTALRAVFRDKDIEFSITFDTKRGRTEAILEVSQGGVFADPMDTHGGGVVDILSFALRCAFLSISQNRFTMILDEPFRFVSRDLIPLVADMIKMVSDKLGLQIIMVSHIDGFQSVADVVFQVTQENGVSKIIEGRI